MNLRQRINLLVELGDYMSSSDPGWQQAKEKAAQENGWFIPAFIDLSINNIVSAYLQKSGLEQWAGNYSLPDQLPNPKTIGLIMAGNIPLVGFHDFLSVFLSGHRQMIKTSSKDATLIRHLAGQLWASAPELKELVFFGEILKGCDAYMATGSNNSARYFDYYFGRYPHLIRHNRTSVALLTGDETRTQLEKLADDVHLYFGLGCRNVTKIYIPPTYDFIPLLETFRKYDYLSDHHKYRNNYDYQLTCLILNKKEYMSNPSILLTENISLFSPISVLYFEYYNGTESVLQRVSTGQDIQCIVGQRFTPFGETQNPALTDYADGVDSLRFLKDLANYQ